MKHDVDNAIKDLNSINQKLYPRDKPKPTLEDYGQKYFMNKETILFALKFLKKAQDEPSDECYALIKDILNELQEKKEPLILEDLFKAMIEQALKEVENENKK